MPDSSTFITRAIQRSPLRGVITELPADQIIHAAGAAGLDFVALDLVTGPNDELTLRRHLSAAAPAGVSVIVVVGDESARHRLLQWGVTGVVVSPSKEIQFPGGQTATLTVVADLADVELFHSAGIVALELVPFLSSSFFRFANVGSTFPLAATPSGQEPLILLPGMLGDVSVWADVVPALPSGQPCAAMRIDLDDTIESMAANVLAAAPRRFSVAGHSLGAIVALEMVRQAPERISRLAILNSSARSASTAQLDAWNSQLDRIEKGEFLDVARDLAEVTVLPNRQDSARLVEHSMMMARKVGADGLARQLRAQRVRPDSLPTLSEITVPTVVISGELDGVSIPDLQAEIVERIPGAQYVTIQGAGHMSLLDQPEAVAAVLTDWLGRI